MTLTCVPLFLLLVTCILSSGLVAGQDAPEQVHLSLGREYDVCLFM